MGLVSPLKKKKVTVVLPFRKRTVGVGAGRGWVGGRGSSAAVPMGIGSLFDSLVSRAAQEGEGLFSD